MQTCIKVISAPALSFTGTVTVTGVTDRNGVPFTPTFAMVHGNSTLNVLESQSATPVGIVSLYWLASGGWDDASTHRGWASATGSRSGNKLTCTGLGPYSIMSEIPDTFFGGIVAREAYISAFRSGEFDITYASNIYTGDSFVVVLFGGADLDVVPVLADGTATVTAGWAPEGVIYTGKGQAGSSASGGTSVSSGIAWAAKTSNQGASTTASTPSANSRFQSTIAAPYTQSTTAFTATGVTLSGLGYGEAAVFFGGTNILCRAGTFNSITGTGNQTIDLGIPATMVYLSGVGAATLGAPDTTEAEHCLGGYDGVTQFSHWVAESATADPPNGARYLSNAHILQFGTPDTLSSSITSRASVVSLSGNNLTINWTLNDGVAKEIIWFAIGGDTYDVTIDKAWVGEAGTTTLRLGTTPDDDDVASDAGADPEIVVTVGPGTYYISESVSADYYDRDIVCTIDGDPLTVGADGEIIIPSGGGTIACTVTNTRTAAGVHVKQWQLYGFNMKLRDEDSA